MIVRCWGARGSIPVSGRDFIRYGGDTTCIEIRSDEDDVIIIDAGTGIRCLGKALSNEERRHMHLFLTHAHWDHLIGFPFFKPIYKKNVHIDVYGCAFAQRSIRNMLSNTMDPPHFPVPFEDIGADVTFHGACDRQVVIKNVRVDPIPISHPNKGLGYRFTEGERRFVFLTDNELGYEHEGAMSFQDYARFCKNADLLIHDSEFTADEYASTRTWGHSTFHDTVDLALEANVRHFGFFHHNQDRTDDALDRIVEECRNKIREAGSVMDAFPVGSEWMMSL